MPVFLDGQQNLAALSVPGVYGDIILPTPFIAGTPTNIEGLVGVASWGKTNALIPVSKPADAAIYIGPPQVRPYDISSYVSAATQVGGSIGFYCVRVTDGTDLAATASIQSGALTLTGACTGSLGNQITASLQFGTAAQSLMAIVAFPGLVPEQFNNVAGPTAATGSATFTGQPTANDTLTIAGSAITFVASGATGMQVNIGTSLPVTLSNLLTFLLASQDTGLVKCTYGLSGSTLSITANQFSGTGTNAGTGGNALTLAKVSTNITVSGATLTGGVGTWQTFWTNLANVINNGNAVRGQSQFVVATAGVSTLMPVVGQTYTFSGGTDGAAGVTDATLMGQDVVPRKGMYVLRNSSCDCFTLCDLSTPAFYAAITSFGLSETMMPIMGTVKGDSIANALATRINSGVDTPWMWLLMGDWPSFFDSFNGYTRLINPAAFGIGIVGNLSPQQSPLNKPLGGVTSTQRSQLGQTYSDTELSQINLGGIDTILPPSSSPGGFYFSFATGRNASSNTAANGVEYTRMTNFLIRAAQSKAAGSIIGQLQSIQPNDQTRAKAKALFDGFSAQLASPQVGLGINGQGMIDKPWSVVCDLSNNPPDLQARGYLFLYWTVRYLNVVRYFVVKFQGGGNVSVTVQSTQPTAQQFQTQVNSGV
ncbi:hypothetical protein HU675_0038215 [Bradyrhizobium septentrionale]|uniref:hypothetical protein n=1 Tax=Bradyrhizobium septentrionale TaxID=1404411 RepID=UPI00159667F8|nr:hypothetical protein [Bradyrhizobium septentrionale]UGY23722.1 hypothetical protein HU675_0038215 [Bradyrhizobium septentrionale]